MDFLGLLSVLVITQTVVVARPSDTNLKTKRSIDEPNIFKPSKITFPVVLENGFTVIINGTLDTTSGTFEVVLPSRSRTENEHCRIKYNFENSMLDISPEHPDWKTEKYKLSKHEGNPTFSIKLKAWTVFDKHSFKLSFEGNSGGESSIMTCELDKFEDFENIEFGKGLHSITNFSVDFQNRTS